MIHHFPQPPTKLPFPSLEFPDLRGQWEHCEQYTTAIHIQVALLSQRGRTLLHDASVVHLYNTSSEIYY